MNRSPALLLALAGAMLPPAVFGDLHESLQLHGFLTQGFVQTSDNRFFGDSENGSWEMTEIGLNASIRPTPDLLLAGQLLSRRAGDMYDGSPMVDFALADYTLHSTESSRFGLIAGRIKNPLGLYNETRDVAFTRPGVFVPQVIYFDKVRNLILSSDGLQLYADLYGDLGNWSLELTGGRTQVDTNVEYAYLFRDFAGSLEADGITWLGRLMFETPDSRLRLALSAAQSTMTFDPAPGDPLEAGSTEFLYWIASAQYNAENWSLTAEFMREPIDWEDYGPFFPVSTATGEGWYLQGAYRLRHNLELSLRYEEGYADTADRDGENASAATGGYVPPFNFFSKNWVFGIGWEPTPNLLLRAEYQISDGTFILSDRENPDPRQLVQHWDMFSLLASYRF